jgi:hypothetical protein
MLEIDNLDLAAWAKVPFAGNASMITAMRHPAYRTNVEYREACEAKVIGMSKNTFTATAYGLVERELTETGQAPESQAREIQKAETRAAEDAWREQYGPLAVRRSEK